MAPALRGCSRARRPRILDRPCRRRCTAQWVSPPSRAMRRVRSVSADRSAVTLVFEDADGESHAGSLLMKREARSKASVDHRDLAPSVLIEHTVRRGGGRLADA